jgi:two-component system osmolarity sensor histidine kinase EnvZ
MLVVISASVIMSSTAEHSKNNEVKLAQIALALSHNSNDRELLSSLQIKTYSEKDITDIQLNRSLLIPTENLQSYLNTRLGPNYQVLINSANGDTWIRDKLYHRWLYMPQLTITPNHLLYVILPLICLLFLVNFWFWFRVIRPLSNIHRGIIRFKKTGFPTKLKKANSHEIDNIIHNINGMTNEIYRSGQERSLMLASIVHDLKSPLTRLQLRADFVEDDELQRGFLNDCLLMGKLINQVVSYLHVSAFSKAATVNSICRRIVRYPEFNQHSIGLGLRLPEYIQLPELETERIILNLLGNACEYGKPPFECHTRLEQNNVIISVSDQGKGIADRDWQHAIRPFVRLEKHRPVANPHSGLGLATVAKLARYLGGEVTRSHQEQRFTIAVIIPLKQSDRHTD